jgi:hypothetical protein
MAPLCRPSKPDIHQHNRCALAGWTWPQRTLYRGKFEFTHVSASAVIVKELATARRMLLKSVYGAPLLPGGLHIYRDRFVVGRTTETLLLGDLDSCNLSEVPWRGDGAWPAEGAGVGSWGD